MHGRLELDCLPGINIVEGDPAISDADLVLVVQVKIEAEMRDLLIPQVLSSGLNDIVSLGRNRTEFFKLSQRHPDDDGTGLRPVDHLSRRVLRKRNTNSKRQKQNSRYELRHNFPALLASRSLIRDPIDSIIMETVSDSTTYSALLGKIS